jgi:lipopolysaccharide export LptBFGC system permease protein LptF
MNSKKSFLVSAEELKTKENLDNFELNFKEGSLYQDLFTESSSIVSNFDDLKLSLDIDESRLETISLTKLFDYSSSSDDASFQWNVSIPITIIVLLFMGVYMSSVSPRQGRFSVILPGMLMYVMYLSLLIVGREFIAENPNSALGLWWVHLLFAMTLIIYMSKDKINLNIISGGIWKESKYSKFPLAIILLLLLFWLVI